MFDLRRSYGSCWWGRAAADEEEQLVMGKSCCWWGRAACTWYPRMWSARSWQLVESNRLMVESSRLRVESSWLMVESSCRKAARMWYPRMWSARRRQLGKTPLHEGEEPLLPGEASRRWAARRWAARMWTARRMAARWVGCTWVGCTWVGCISAGRWLGCVNVEVDVTRHMKILENYRVAPSESHHYDGCE